MNQNLKKKQNNEEEKPLVDENIKMHTLSAPTVGKKHEWIQQGPNLVCKSCESPHGIRIGVHKRLVGFDKDNNMIIENV